MLIFSLTLTLALAGPLDSFLSPLPSQLAQGGDLATFPAADAASCAAACLANSSCISFNYALGAAHSLKTCGIVGDCYAPNASSCPSYLTLSCPGGVFTEVEFAAYGLPIVGSSGPCDFSLPPGTCNNPSAAGVFEAACVGQSTCTIDATLSTFGSDPCPGVYKFIAARLAGENCSSAPQPPAPAQCTLSGYSQGYTLAPAANTTSYYQRLLPRNDSRVTPAVPYLVQPPPARSVVLPGGPSAGLLAGGFATNLAYLANMNARASVDDLLYPYRRRHNASAPSLPGKIFGWDSFVPGSVASMILMGAGQALRWTEAPALRSVLEALLQGIADAAEEDGFAVGYAKADTNSAFGGNNQNPSYVNSWFTHGMLDSADVDPRALALARNFNSWWNNCTYLPQLFPQDGGERHVGPSPHGYNPAAGYTSSAPFAHGHLLYWMNQAGIGHSRMAMSEAGTQADVDFLVNLFQEDWWLEQLAARNLSAIYARKWCAFCFGMRRKRAPLPPHPPPPPSPLPPLLPPPLPKDPDNYEVCVFECYLDLYSLTGEAKYLNAVLGGWDMYRDPKQGWMFPGGSVALNENFLYPPGSLPLEFQGSWGVTSRPTGELCPSAFWIKLNQRLHRLYPDVEAYIGEVELALYNVALAGQQLGGGGTRYFARLHGHKDKATAVGTCCEGQSTRVFGGVHEHIFSLNAALAPPSSSTPLHLRVNLYEPATLALTTPSGTVLNVTLATAFPWDTRVDLLLSCSAPLPASALLLSVRLPSWSAAAQVPVYLQGALLQAWPAGTYAHIAPPGGEDWPCSTGVANVSFSLLMAPRVWPYGGVSQKAGYSRAAYTFGPFLLAGVGQWSSALDGLDFSGVVGGAGNPAAWLLSPGLPGALPRANFSVAGVPGAVMMPYYAISEEQFSAYPFFAAAAAAPSAQADPACTSALQCSGAGACTAGACVCLPGFVGSTCAMLNNATVLPMDSGFRLPNTSVWGSQVVLGDDGLYHMAASVYPGDLDFYKAWLLQAQIVHAVAPTPAGPFSLRGVALGYGGVGDWDRSVMNPKLLRAPDGTWLLFYTGDGYRGPWPTPKDPVPVDERVPQAAQRVGLAVAASPAGPFARTGAPVLEPRADKWDARITTNAAVTLMHNGTLLLIYKASNPAGANTTQTQVCFGVASAPDWRSPFVRARDDPILPCPPHSFLAEDPCVFYTPATGFYHLIFKDFSGEITHAGYSGAHAISTDGVNWAYTQPALAYTTTHLWSDGKVRTQKQQERPQVLLGSDGAPLGIYYATNTGLDGQPEFWNMYQPLR